MPAEAIDGMDVIETEEAAARAVARVRADGFPMLLEFRTYRFRAHSMFDAELYRDKAEVERWKERGPVKTLVERLAVAGLGGPEDQARLEAEADAEVAAAVALARAGTPESVAELTRFVYAEEALNARLPVIPRGAGGS
jgi:TPP-dependent pyruvate/acetoin dehydrogenase alpha subunit